MSPETRLNVYRQPEAKGPHRHAPTSRSVKSVEKPRRARPCRRDDANTGRIVQLKIYLFYDQPDSFSLT